RFVRVFVERPDATCARALPSNNLANTVLVQGRMPGQLVSLQFERLIDNARYKQCLLAIELLIDCSFDGDEQRTFRDWSWTISLRSAALRGGQRRSDVGLLCNSQEFNVENTTRIHKIGGVLSGDGPSSQVVG